MAGSFGRLLAVSWGFFGSLLGDLEGSRGILGSVLDGLGPSWADLGRSWAALGRSWGSLGCSWDALGASLGRSWALRGHSGVLLGRSWQLLGRSRPHLGRSGGSFGLLLKPLRPILEALEGSWVALGLPLAALEGQKCIL